MTKRCQLAHRVPGSIANCDCLHLRGFLIPANGVASQYAKAEPLKEPHNLASCVWVFCIGVRWRRQRLFPPAIVAQHERLKLIVNFCKSYQFLCDAHRSKKRLQCDNDVEAAVDAVRATKNRTLLKQSVCCPAYPVQRVIFLD